MRTSPVLDKTAGIVLALVLTLVPIVSHAGGLGIAPLAFILGLMGFFLYFKINANPLHFSFNFIALVIFLFWLCITAVWSPYRVDDLLTNYIKLFIMGISFYFAPVVFRHVAEKKQFNMQRFFVHLMFVSVFLVTIDVSTNFKITLFFNPASNPDELVYRLIDAEQNLGHAITVLVLLLAPTTILLKAHFKAWKFLSCLFFILILMASFQNNLWIGLIGAIGVGVTSFLAYKFPRVLPKLLLWIAGCTIILAPLIAFMSSIAIKGDLSHIPGSWEHRLRMWAYCWTIILENLLSGAGFDAVRTYDEQWTTRHGLDLTIVSLHPHNMGIHIWTETGFIGALLALAVIVTSFKLVDRHVTGSAPDRAIMISGIIIAAILISSFSYGAWQFWWLGSIFFSIGLIHLVPKTYSSRV